MTHDSADAGTEEFTEGGGADPEDVRGQVEELRRHAERERISDLWRQGAEGLQTQWTQQAGKLDAIHRDLRMVGDMLLDFTDRLEALEKRVAADRGQVRGAWERQSE